MRRGAIGASASPASTGVCISSSSSSSSSDDARQQDDVHDDAHPPSVPTPPPPPPRSDVMPSKAVLTDRFALIEAVGEGGCGAVWKARDRVDDQLYALKLMDTSAKSDEMARREIGVLINFVVENGGCKPYVVRYVDYFATQHDGQRHNVVQLEFVDGVSMKQWQQQKRAAPLSATEAETVAYRVAHTLTRAVADLHRNRIAHQDIKPANVMMRRSTDGTVEEPVLIDFGIACVDSALSTESAVQCDATNTWGSALFKSPERLRYCDTSHRYYTFAMRMAADVWALGLTLWAALQPSDVDVVRTLQAHQTMGNVHRYMRSYEGTYCTWHAAVDALIRGALTYDHERRPTAPTLLTRLETGEVESPPRAERDRSVVDAGGGGGSGGSGGGAAGIGDTQARIDSGSGDHSLADLYGLCVGQTVHLDGFGDVAVTADNMQAVLLQLCGDCDGGGGESGGT